MMGMLQPLGIEKGRPFSPTDRQRQLLIDAAQTGEVMARAIAYRKRFDGAKVWSGRNWELSLFLKETNQEAPHHTQLDERTSWFYEAVGVSVGMMGRAVGVGQVYLEAAKDSQDRWLDGGRTYRLTVPKDVPVAQFWSVTVYDNETRCFVNSGVSPDRSSRDAIVTNGDGSVDITFGPTPPPACRRAIGSRRSLGKAGSATSASTARRRPTSTARGCFLISSGSSRPRVQESAMAAPALLDELRDRLSHVPTVTG